MGKLEQRCKSGMDVLLAAHHLHGERTYRSIADATDIPLATVHRAVKRGMKDPLAVRRAAVVLGIGKWRNLFNPDHPSMGQ